MKSPKKFCTVVSEVSSFVGKRLMYLKTFIIKMLNKDDFHSVFSEFIFILYLGPVQVEVMPGAGRVFVK